MLIDYTYTMSQKRICNILVAYSSATLSRQFPILAIFSGIVLESTKLNRFGLSRNGQFPLDNSPLGHSPTVLG